jgi:hypothetical protein
MMRRMGRSRRRGGEEGEGGGGRGREGEGGGGRRRGRNLIVDRDVGVRAHALIQQNFKDALEGQQLAGRCNGYSLLFLALLHHLIVRVVLVEESAEQRHGLGPARPLDASQT